MAFDQNVLNAVGVAAQTLTALMAALIALFAYLATKAFNKGQAIKFMVEHINDYNRQIIEIAIHNTELGKRIGRPVLENGDVIADYLNFMIINHIHLVWNMERQGVFTKAETKAKIDNAARFLQRNDEAYMEIILSRGYEEKFARAIKKAIADVGGYAAADATPT